MHCAVCRSRHEERERRESAISLRVAVLLHGKARPLRGQNSGQFWTLTMIFGVLDMPEWSQLLWYRLFCAIVKS